MRLQLETPPELRPVSQRTTRVEDRRNRNSGLWLPVILCCTTIALAFALWQSKSANTRLLTKERVVTPRSDLTSGEKSTIELFKQGSRSLTYITTSQVRRDFSFNLEEIPRGTGSGFIWDKQGHVVTNYHVVDRANVLKVTLADQSTWKAELVGAAPGRDLAVLKIDAPAEKLFPIPIGTSDDLMVGQSVFALGNPFGLDQTLTTGVISGLGREIRARNGRKIEGVIQTDAAINPGNSGGPLLDSSGRLIGVNTAIFSPSGTFAGIGFAIPADSVNRVVPEILKNGKLTRAGMNIRIAPDSVVQRLGIRGVLILEAQEGGAAFKAGIQSTREDRNGEILLGDIVVAVEGKPIKRQRDLLDELDRYDVGAKLKIKVVRDGGTRQERVVDVPVTLQAIN